MMLLGTAALAVPCYFAKQSQILCYIIVGALVGTVKDERGLSWAEQMHLSVETSAALYDLGILFVLFMAGMDVDIGALKKAWKLVLINGCAQIFCNLGAWVAICVAVSGKGSFFDGMKMPGVGTFFFGICCTLSSTILVLGALKKRGEMSTSHGQIILGLMVMQDLTAVLSIAVMVNAFGPTASPDVAIGAILGGLIMWIAIVLIFLVVLNRTILERVFSSLPKHASCFSSAPLPTLWAWRHFLGIFSPRGPGALSTKTLESSSRVQVLLHCPTACRLKPSLSPSRLLAWYCSSSSLARICRWVTSQSTLLLWASSLPSLLSVSFPRLPGPRDSSRV